MSEHLSNLVLDELAVQLPVGPESTAHLEQCAECRARLEKLRTVNAAFSARLDAARVRLEVAKRAEQRPSPQWQRWAPAVGLAMAASVTLMVFWGKGPLDTTTLKGPAVLELINQQGHPVTAARVGERVELRIGGGGLPQGAVLALDGQRTVSCLWQGRVPAGISNVQTLEVSPGDVLVHLVLGDSPVECSVVARAYQQRVDAAPSAGAALVPEVREPGRVLSAPLHVTP